MKCFLLILLGGCVLHPTLSAQTYDEELTKLSTGLGASLEKAGLKTVAIGGFKDLQGKEPGLGKLLIEDLSVDLVNQNKGVSVVDRANLSRLMDEYKLTEEGLVIPENAKKLKIEGIDAIILGTIVPFDKTYRIQIKAIATDSAKVVAATRGTIAETVSLDALMGVTRLQAASGSSSPSAVSSSDTSTTETKVPKVYDLGSISARIDSIAFFQKSGKVRVTYSVTNKESGPLTFAYHLIDKNAPNDDYQNFGLSRQQKRDYKPSYEMSGELTDDKGQSYTLNMPHDALSLPLLSPSSETAFTVEYLVVAEPGSTVQIPASVSFWVEFFAGGYGYRSPRFLNKFSVVDAPINKLF